MQDLKKQAENMKAISDKSRKQVKIGDIISISIPDVDKAKRDLKNIIGVVLQINEDRFYKNCYQPWHSIEVMLQVSKPTNFTLV